MDAYWFLGLSDWLINLSAGWFTAGFIVPGINKRNKKLRFRLLTYNLLFAIVSLLLAIQIKRSIGVL